MHPKTKLYLISAGFCAALAALNWHYTIQHTRALATTEWKFPVVAFALVLSGGLTVYFALRCLKLARGMIETGRKVSPGRWIPHPEVVLFLMPLLWRQQTTSSWYEADRSLTVVTKGYGHELTFWVILFAIAELLLFQIFTRLSQNGNVPNQAADSTVSAGTSAAEQPRVPASAASHL